MCGLMWKWITIIWLLFGNFVNAQVLEDKLKNLLTDSEWLHMIGSSPNVDYEIVYPKYLPPNGTLTNGTQKDLVHLLLISAPQLKEEFAIEVVPNPYLLADDFQIVEGLLNGTQWIREDKIDPECYFRGHRSALSVCNGEVKGIVYSNATYFYLINPLPKRFQKNEPKPHLILRKLHTIPPLIHSCVHDQDGTEVNPRRKREASSLPMGAPIFVETAVFADKDLFQHMKINYPIDTERELIRFVLAMINAVQLLYHDPSLGRPVNFVLKRLEIMKEEAPGLNRVPDIDRYLSNFCTWQRGKNPAGDKEPLHWDHALILTGLDLYVRGKHGKISSQVVGLAPVAGMCTPTSSCTVNEGRHFESVYVVAHEIGHNLGMRHDGPLADNDCDPSSYIMSPTLGSGKITWSACSRRYLQKFLDTTQSQCLLDHGSSAGQLDHSAEGALPGERFDATQQCMLKYGRGSKHSSQQPLDDVCRDLHCERERYTWTSHPALEGTKCGEKMWCRGGACVPKDQPTNSSPSNKIPATLQRMESINGGWSKWMQYNECASGCLFGEEGRLRSGSTGIIISERICDSPRPAGGGATCDGHERKYRTCQAQQCLNVPRLTIREFANQVCTSAQAIDSDLTGLGMQKISTDPEEACLVWCRKRNGETKSRGWTFPDGTTCTTRRNKYGRASYCINGRCEDFVCDSYDESQFLLSQDLCPNDRDDNEILWRTGSRHQERAVVKWKSASGCHYNCIRPGTGIRLVMSKGKHGKSSIQLCQPEQFGCTKYKTAFQHASMVCNKYKERVRRLSGLGMQISPAIEDPDRSCRIACQDETIPHRFYLVNGEEGWFPFGTDCTRGTSNKKAFCISGKCLEFGSDDTPLSENVFTLPLLARLKRSLDTWNKTRIREKIDDLQLNEIIRSFNRSITNQLHLGEPSSVDLDNPIHVDEVFNGVLGNESEISDSYYQNFHYYDIYSDPALSNDLDSVLN